MLRKRSKHSSQQFVYCIEHPEKYGFAKVQGDLNWCLIAHNWPNQRMATIADRHPLDFLHTIFRYSPCSLKIFFTLFGKRNIQNIVASSFITQPLILPHCSLHQRYETWMIFLKKRLDWIEIIWIISFKQIYFLCSFSISYLDFRKFKPRWVADKLHWGRPDLGELVQKKMNKKIRRYEKITTIFSIVGCQLNICQRADIDGRCQSDGKQDHATITKKCSKLWKEKEQSIWELKVRRMFAHLEKLYSIYYIYMG